MTHRLILLFTFFFFGSLAQFADAEPWISNRWAQNCAACHAPGRLNLPPVGRRCTLSCQGCHVNPNGGGLRNEYGKWNQQRWVRSFKNEKTLGHKRTPAPHYKQPYMKSKPNNKGVYPVKNFTVVKNPWVSDEQFTNKIYKDWHKDAKSKREFLSRIPYDDPYRLERDFDTTVGGDFRWIFGELSGDVPDTVDTSYSFGMAADIGVRIRPIREKVSAVVEARFANGPNFSDIENMFTSDAYVRSAYILADDLWYNSYVMGGIYTPMFGNATPDHTRLSADITGLDQNAVYKGFGAGIAPNVPFANINILQAGADENFTQDEGYVINIGARAVTLSLSGVLSYWSTEDKFNDVEKEMIAAAGGFMFKDFIGTGELVNFNVKDGARNKGFVGTIELKYRVWRENYIMLNYSESNTTRTRAEGQATESMIGVKSFLYPGSELELLYISRFEKRESGGGSTTNTDLIQLQTHLYF
ncbi:MAG: hypothetical protein R2827_03685 [Bdellovibrionales bacterium]